MAHTAASPETLVYLVRHATPDFTRTDLPYHRPPGPPLIPQGEREAEALGAYLQQAGVHRVWTSPLERCHHTAQVIARLSRASLEVAEALIEWQPGESEAEVRARLWPVFERARSASRAGQTPALVSHGGPIAVLLAALGMPADELERQRVYDHRNPLPPAGVWRASQIPGGADWRLALVYLPPEGGA